MKPKEKAPTESTQVAKENPVPNNMEPTLASASEDIEQPLDPKEEARRRSRADLERQRSRLRGKSGNF